MSTMPGPEVTTAAPGDTMMPGLGYIGEGTTMGGLGTMMGALHQQQTATRHE